MLHRAIFSPEPLRLSASYSDHRLESACKAGRYRRMKSATCRAKELRTLLLIAVIDGSEVFLRLCFRVLSFIVRQPFEHRIVSLSKIFDNGIDSFRTNSNFGFLLEDLPFHMPMLMEPRPKTKTMATPFPVSPAHRFGGLAGVSSHGSGLVHGFALTSPFPYTDSITRCSILSEGADHGNAHDLPLG